MICNHNCFFSIKGHTKFWIRNVQGGEHFAETTAILCDIHVIVAGTNDFNAFFLEFFGQFQCSLSAQLNDNAFGFLVLNQFPQMFPINGLKVEFIGHIKIRTYRFGVTIDHNRFITCLASGHDSVNATVIKLDTLSDAIWTAT